LNIDDLPDFPAIKQLSRALWSEGTTRRAALLVGAGFSKNADRPAPNTPEPPLWSDLAHAMIKDLYPKDANPKYRDPLRLAEEYKTYFGHAELDQLIRTHIPDAAWQPGALHYDLLKLPWTDILTTNWDTLLERTADEIDERRYEIVRSQTDLAHTKSPRIVKLHGSLGTTEHFTLTDEDYRIFPAKYAAFVNFARQVFIENELCLLGFSGDDPNFLQWTGWVRDNLAGNTRRIYLVGVLDLAPAVRKLLESRNIAPIDLSPIVASENQNKHQFATEKFIKFLVNSKPKPLYEWEPTSGSSYDFFSQKSEDFRRYHQDAAYAASILDQSAEIWTQDRNTYPQWLICPDQHRHKLHIRNMFVSITQEKLELIQPYRQAQILYEMVWRTTTSLEGIDETIVPLLEKIANPNENPFLSREQCLEIAVALLRHAHVFRNDNIFLKSIEILRAHSQPGDDFYAETAYQSALRARDQLDYTGVMAEINEIEGNDPIWLLRRASLLWEVNENEEAEKLILNAMKELSRRNRQDPQSLWILSRLSLAQSLDRVCRLNKFSLLEEKPWPDQFRRAFCDPYEEIKNIKDKSAEKVRQEREDKSSSIPPFQAGYYRVKSKNHQNVGSDPGLVKSIGMLMETTGLPMRLQHVDVLGSAARDVAELSCDYSIEWFIWLIRSLNEPCGTLFERHFSRIAVALIPSQTCYDLMECINRELLYWRQKIDAGRHGNFKRIRLLIELLSRLVVRQSPGKARATLNMVIEMSKAQWIDHVWLNEPVNNLIRGCIEALPPVGQEDVILPLLSFPLSKNELRFPTNFPEPFDHLWKVEIKRNPNDIRWDSAITNLIQSATPQSACRPASIIRLTKLFISGALNEKETAKFSSLLWEERDQQSELPDRTSLLTYMFGVLPAPICIDQYSLVNHSLFDVDINQTMSPPVPLGSLEIDKKVNLLRGMFSSVKGPVKPSSIQTINLFDAIILWRPPSNTNIDPFEASFLYELHGHAGRNLGDILRFVVVPSLQPSERTADRARALLNFINNVPKSTAIGALSYFMGDDDAINRKIVQTVSQAVVGRSEEEVTSAATAVQDWAMDSACANGQPLPPQLIERIISAVESRRETGLLPLLQCSHKLVRFSAVSSNQQLRLVATLIDMFEEYEYDKIDQESNRAITASLVRAECVRIAALLNASGEKDVNLSKWVEAAEHDPLPEVRFALLQLAD
jgi:hypothetical protein